MIRTLPEALERLATFETHLFQAQRLAIRATQQCDVLLRHLRQGIVHFDPAGYVALLSDEACRQLGLELPAAQWHGLSAAALAEQVGARFVDPASFAVENAQFWQQGAQPGTVLPLVNGRVLERDVLPVPDERGCGFLVSYRDVTTSYRARWPASGRSDQSPTSSALGA